METNIPTFYHVDHQRTVFQHHLRPFHAVLQFISPHHNSIHACQVSFRVIFWRRTYDIGRMCLSTKNAFWIFIFQFSGARAGCDLNLVWMGIRTFYIFITDLVEIVQTRTALRAKREIKHCESMFARRTQKCRIFYSTVFCSIVCWSPRYRVVSGLEFSTSPFSLWMS